MVGSSESVDRRNVKTVLTTPVLTALGPVHQKWTGPSRRQMP